MAKMRHAVKYIEIAEELMQEIYSGKYKAGDRLYSRSELAARYNIGDVTAVRVQNYLADVGLVRKVRGGGIYVNYASDSFPVKLEQDSWPQPNKIIELRFKQNTKNGENFIRHFNDEIERCIAERDISYQLRIFTASEVSENVLNTFPIDPDAGYLVTNVGSMSLLFSAQILLNATIHSVLLDGIIPCSNCVITDSFDGMGKIVDYAVASGYKNFIFAKNFVKSLGDFYNEDRAYGAQYHCSRHGYKCNVIDSGSYDELVHAVRSSPENTTVMFPQDEGAYRLKKLLGRHKQTLLITGFDDCNTDCGHIEEPDPEIPTIRPDYQKMVETAVDILSGKPCRRKQIVRVSGELIIHT